MDEETEETAQDTTPAQSAPTAPLYRKYKPKTGFHTWLEMLSWRSPTATKCVADAMIRFGRPKLGAIVASYVRHGSSPLDTDSYDFWRASGPEGRVWCEDMDKLYRGSPDMEECIVEYAYDTNKCEVMCLLTHTPTDEVVCTTVPMETDVNQERAEKNALDLAWVQLHLGKLVDA